MENLKLLEKLYKIENMDELKSFIGELEQKERDSAFTGDRKKAISMIKQFTKKHHIQVLQSSIKGDDGYYYQTDSYILVKSTNQILPLIENKDDYPKLNCFINMASSYEPVIDIKTINYNDVVLNYTQDKASISDLTDLNGNIRSIANKYIKTAIDFLGTENVKVCGDSKNTLKPLIFKNDNTGEFVLISACRKCA